MLRVLRNVRDEGRRELCLFVELGEGNAERKGISLWHSRESHCSVPGNQQTHRGHVSSITFIIVT